MTAMKLKDSSHQRRLPFAAVAWLGLLVCLLGCTVNLYLFTNRSPASVLPLQPQTLLQQGQPQTLQGSSRGRKRGLASINPVTLYNKGGDLNIWDLFPPVANCPDLVRLGNVGDGGKWVCGVTTSTTSPGQDCVVYSVGVSFDVSFEASLLEQSSRKNCRVFAFDPSVGKLPPLPEDIAPRFTFRKLAIEPGGTVPSEHLLSAHLFDLMRDFGHSYIDVLKIDIEGKEWSVFEELASRVLADPLFGGTLPVGQLLIELHVLKTLDLQHVQTFFANMQKMGFVPVSREINLQPCSAGRPPVASEYTLVNTRARVPIPPAPSLATSAAPSVKGLVYILSHKLRTKSLLRTLRTLQNNFLREFPQYPVVIFHDDFSESDILKIKSGSTIRDDAIFFSRIAFSMPLDLVKRGVKIPPLTACSPDSSTVAYRHMCLFQAHGVHQALAGLGSPLSDVEYILRLDDDSLLTSPIGYDLFAFMKRHGKLYGFVNHLKDDPLCVAGLWNATQAFMLESQATKGHNFSASWFHKLPDGFTFYNNFEISHVSVWRKPVWRDYMEHVERLGGIYTVRWGDAPIHTIGVSLALDLSQVHRFADIGYTHVPFVKQPASGLPRPHANPLLSLDDYKCSFFDHWSCNKTAPAASLSSASTGAGGGGGVVALLPNKPAWVDNVVETPHPPSLPGPSNRVASNKGKSSIALYTFASGGKEGALVKAMSSFYDNFVLPLLAAKDDTYAVSFVIFHAVGGSFQPDAVEHALEEQYGKQTMLSRALMWPVIIRTTLADDLRAVDYEESCLPRTGEDRGVSYFFRRQAAAVMGKMGFHWLFRFSLDSALDKPLPPSLFFSLERDGRVYAYLSRGPVDKPKCASAAWEAAVRFCAEHKAGDSRCSSLFPRDWPKHEVFQTSLEITRASVWQSPQCQGFLDQLERTVATHEDIPDATLHTLCIAMSLRPGQMLQLEGVAYRRVATVQGGGALVERKRDAVQPAALSPPLPNDRYELTPLPSINALFEPQRFGWLGGDVAASVPMPPPYSQAKSNSSSNRFLWLFGDTLVGTSSATARLEGVIVSNSVGVASLSQDGLDLRMRYHWGVSVSGAPEAVLVFAGSKTKAAFWPLGGLAVASSAGASLLVVGPLVLPVPGALGFSEQASALFSVSNPLDPPSDWQYMSRAFKHTGEGEHFRWLAMCESGGRPFATDDAWVYIYGIFSPSKYRMADFDMFGLQSREEFQVLGRLRAGAALRLELDSLEVLFPDTLGWRGADSWGSFTPGAAWPSAVFRPSVSEMSISFSSSAAQWTVTSMRFMEGVIRMCRANKAHGPFLCDVALLVPPPYYEHKLLHTYAAKTHPELLSVALASLGGNYSRSNNDGAILHVVSFLTNPVKGPKELFSDWARASYIPRFFLLTIW